MSVEAIKQATTAVDRYVEELTKRIEEAKTYAAEQEVVLEFIQAFPDTEGLRAWEGTRTSFTLDAGTVKALMINRDYTALTEVTEHLRFLAQRLGKYTIDDYPELGRRAYVFNKGRFRFQCFFNNSDANVCRFVQVGVEEKPVYKLMCGEEVMQHDTEEPAA